MRLSKFLSSAGIASRRASEKLITTRRIKVDGRIITDPAFDVDSQNKIEFDNKRIEPVSSDKLIYLMLNKPIGVISTMSPGKEIGLCLADLVPIDTRVYPVGRLDLDTSGLIILTNDGPLTQHLTHPKHKVKKEYHLKTNRPLLPNDYKRINRGIPIDSIVVEVDELIPIRGGKFAITIHEGRKRIIRKLFTKVGYRLIELKRVSIGSVGLGRLSVGKWRYLTDKEVESLKTPK
ncbi:MAG: pseudouridine synthase [Candidatus Hatepunaea meridiana]|nr:pseudouridine synthase [Candidatus Hatepunaea meridiana]